MRGFLGGPMAAEMVILATSERLKETDWTRNIEICELVTRDPGQSKCVIKSIKKQLKNKNVNTQFFSVMLLEMLINNCGDHIHKQVMDNKLLPMLVKIVKKKTDLPVRERIFLLLDAAQTALGGVSGRYPQYYTAYYDLVSAGVQFPQRPHVMLPEESTPQNQAKCSPQESHFHNCENIEKQVTTQLMPDSSIIHRASSVLEVLRDVLNTLDPKIPQGATDEFTLDLVEQCSFQKQRIMHLVMTSRDEKLVTQAIELNEQLHQVLTHHDSLLSVCDTATPTSCVNEEGEEEEDAESLYRRIRKGKACAEDHSESSVIYFRPIPEENMNRPIIRPLRIQSSDSDSRPSPTCRQSSDPGIKQHPPAHLSPHSNKNMESDKFLDNKRMDGSDLAGHIRDLSLHSRNASSSGSCSTDWSERDVFGFRD
ncbi:VHS and GAT domain containing protein [Musa troglodytarum]|uniref:VHS and GAT domain containing protein n=1 Tax=Musa troglodytarum TaxID=320322 RepID=A0A9E7GL82_9LILI|nr:VHS and GAT domain containing protein [Musa troglodytarum]